MFKIDWKDKAAVISYCKKIGGGSVVVKYPNRENYNITHLERALTQPCEIIFKG